MIIMSIQKEPLNTTTEIEIPVIMKYVDHSARLVTNKQNNNSYLIST